MPVFQGSCCWRVGFVGSRLFDALISRASLIGWAEFEGGKV